MDQLLSGRRSLKKIDEYEYARQKLKEAPDLFKWMTVFSGYGLLTVKRVEYHDAIGKAFLSENQVVRLTAASDLQRWYKILEIGPLQEDQWRDILSWLAGEVPGSPFRVALKEGLELLAEKCKEYSHFSWVKPYGEAVDALLSLKF